MSHDERQGLELIDCTTRGVYHEVDTKAPATVIFPGVSRNQAYFWLKIEVAIFLDEGWNQISSNLKLSCSPSMLVPMKYVKHDGNPIVIVCSPKDPESN